MFHELFCEVDIYGFHELLFCEVDSHGNIPTHHVQVYKLTIKGYRKTFIKRGNMYFYLPTKNTHVKISGWHMKDVFILQRLFLQWYKGGRFPEQFLRQIFQRHFPNIKMIRQETDCEKGTPESKKLAIDHVIGVLKSVHPLESAHRLVHMYTRRRKKRLPSIVYSQRSKKRLHPRIQRKNKLLEFVFNARKHLK